MRSARGAGPNYWERCGKVQEHTSHTRIWPRPQNSVSYDMRRSAGVLGSCLVTAVMVMAGGAGAVAGQGRGAELTPTDSAILASQPLKRLVFTPSLVRRLSLLAAGLDREVVLCLEGEAAGDSAVLREFVMPDVVSSAADAVQPEPCGRGTLAVWHNHPWTGPDSSFGVKTPEDLCSLSQPDLRTVVADSTPFAVVSVGRLSGDARGPRTILCWWRRVQAVVNRRVKFLPRFPHQWVEVPLLAGGAEPGVRQPAASVP
jgi:hypothetical protein